MPQIFGLPGLISLTPLVLLITHYYGGAENTADNTLYYMAISLSTLGILTLLASRMRAATPGLAFTALAFATWIALGLGGEWVSARPEIISLATAGLVFLTGRAAGQSTPTLVFVWKALVWSLLAYTLLALIAHLLNYTSDPLDIGRYETSRLQASFVSANTAATLFACSALIAMGRLIYAVNHAGSRVKTRNDLVDYIFRRAFAAIVLFVLSVNCLWLTSSRAGIAFFLVVLIGFIGAEYRVYRKDSETRNRKFKLARWLVFLAAVLIAGRIFTGEILDDRISEAAGDVKTRLGIYQIYWEAWQQRPWFGHGLGSFSSVNDALMTAPNDLEFGLVGAAHNVGLQWLIQQGVVGTGLMIMLLVFIHIPMLRVVLGSSSRSATILRLALSMSALVLMHGMVDYALEVPSVMWTYTFILGMAHGRSTTILEPLSPATKPNEESTFAGAENVV